MHNCKKFKYIFIVFGKNHPDALLYERTHKIYPKIYVSRSIADVIMTSLKMPLLAADGI